MQVRLSSLYLHTDFDPQAVDEHYGTLGDKTILVCIFCVTEREFRVKNKVNIEVTTRKLGPGMCLIMQENTLHGGGASTKESIGIHFFKKERLEDFFSKELAYRRS